MHTILARLAVAVAASVLPLAPACAQSGTPSTRLDCTNGPLAKNFGAWPWLVFACSDHSSLVVVSNKNHPSGTYFFKLFVKDGKRYVVGEGSIPKAVTAAAYRELEKLTEAEIAALIEAAMKLPEGEAG